MNIEIKASNIELLEKICKETEMSPSQLIEYFLGLMSFWHSSYEKEKNENIEKRPFIEILGKLFLHAFKSKLRALDVTDKLIKCTNNLLGIEHCIGAIIVDIRPDFDERSISYMIHYDFCTDADHINGYTNFGIEVELNQDHIQISQLQVLPILECVTIKDKDLKKTNEEIQEYIQEAYGKKLLPFTNLSVELYLVGDHPFDDSPNIHQFVYIKIIAKADKAEHLPSIEKLNPITREIQAIVHEELLVK